MVRLAVSVEGATEREFVRRVLGPHLVNFGITAWAIDMEGRISIGRAQPQLLRLLRSPSINYVTTLYDFYGFRERESRDADTLEQDLHRSLDGDRRLIPYIQLHEFEALIFAGPEAAAAALNEPNVTTQMHEIVRKCGAPEQINGRYETCPSRRLKILFPRYDKVLHGPPIIQKIGLAKLRVACPRFGAWLTRLEALVPAPAPASPPLPSHGSIG